MSDDSSSTSSVSGEMTISKPKIALVQAATVVFDTPATLDNVEKIVAEAASNGAELVLFPEAFIGGYIAGLKVGFGSSPSKRTDAERQEYARYFSSAITSDGPESAFLEEVAKRHGVYLVMGVIERENATLYCAVRMPSECQ